MRFNYDVAISFAEENNDVAAQIAVALREREVRYYYYKEQEAESWGAYILHLVNISYGKHSRYILLITGKTYVEKYWSGIELQIAQMMNRPGSPRILQLRLDNTPVPGLSPHVGYQEWRNNPEKIAAMIQRKVNVQKAVEKLYRTRYAMIGLIMLLFISMIWLFSRPGTDTPEIVLEVKPIQITSSTDTFYISETEVTVWQYEQFCKAQGIDLPPQLPSVSPNKPIVNITWEEALAFCKWKKGRLPTEQEWAYAASAGLDVRYSGGNNAAKVAISNRKKPGSVMSRQANVFGVYDMTGNVAEWCSDWSDSSATWKVVRGGSYHSTIHPVNELLINYHSKELPDNRKPDIGFRVAWDSLIKP